MQRRPPTYRYNKLKEGDHHGTHDTKRPLAGKVALVTGGSRGIGAAIAKRLAADGASIAVTLTVDGGMNA